MNINLFINFYIDPIPKRHREIVCCLLDNIRNVSINRLIIYIDEKHLDNFNRVVNSNGLENEHRAKLKPIVSDIRPSYNDYFKLTEDYPHDINIIANTDITMDVMSLQRLKRWNWRNHCLALSRWDYLFDDMDKDHTKHYANRDSQDTWIAKGAFKQIPEATFCLGKRGCDNRIAHLLSQHYHVINPSIDIKTYHYHLTGIRNYCMRTMDDVVQPPYKLLIPIRLPR